MSKGLGWTIKLVAWFSIYALISSIYDGDMSFWAYIFVVSLSFGIFTIKRI